MITTVLLFITGFVLLVKGADLVINGSSSIAKKFNMSNFMIGMTVVAFGTSFPEFAISILAGVSGSTGIAMGNIIGSNITNILLILGVSALIAPLAVKKVLVSREIPFSFLVVVALGFLANDFMIDHATFSGLTRIDGLILILFFCIFIYYTFGIGTEKENIFQKTVGSLQADYKEYHILWSIAMVVIGLFGLVGGAELIVKGGTKIAEYFYFSETVIGLTIVAVGTSLPELAASSMASYRGRTDIAVGNVIGSNIFNILWVLGLSATIGPIDFDPSLNIDLLILLIITLLLVVLIYIGKKNILAKFEGVILLLCYVAYIIFFWYR